MSVVATAPSDSAPRYQRRSPENTVLWQLIQEHLPAFLEQVRDPDDPDSGVPDFVERELRNFLDCGRLQAGFYRLKCSDCAREQLLALSCKARSICPSCATRWMHETALRLCTEVIPDVPLRQWVLSPPFELRGLLGARPELLASLSRLFVQAVFQWYHCSAEADGVARGNPGGIVFIQRWDRFLTLSPHLHFIALDGVYLEPKVGGPLTFHPVAPPGEEDARGLSEHVCWRFVRLLERKGLVDPEGTAGFFDRSPTPLERWFLRAHADRAQRVDLEDDGRITPHAPRHLRLDGSTAEASGFSTHAWSAVRAGDPAARERLIKYAARPAFSSEQFRLAPDGKVLFEIQKKRRSGPSHLLFTPLQILRRLAWQVPPPGRHQLLYYGVFAPASPHRAQVVPAPAPPQPCTRHPADPALDLPLVAIDGFPPKPRSGARSAASGDPQETPAQKPRRWIPWAILLHHAYGFDALACTTPNCKGRLRPIALINDPPVVRRILAHLRLPTEPGPFAAPRPAWPRRSPRAPP